MSLTPEYSHNFVAGSDTLTVKVELGRLLTPKFGLAANFLTDAAGENNLNRRARCKIIYFYSAQKPTGACILEKNSNSKLRLAAYIS